MQNTLLYEGNYQSYRQYNSAKDSGDKTTTYKRRLAA